MKQQFEISRRELVTSLQTLRVMTREVGNNYIGALQADITRIEQAVRHAHEDDISDRKQLAQFRSMLEAIHKLNLKPRKGRRRDLKQVDSLVSDFSDTVDQW